MSNLPSLDNLRCFLAAARVLHFRKAARAVALTPTAFGHRLKQLEEQLGTPLFARTTRSVSLTEAGIALIPLAERCLAAAEEVAGWGGRGPPRRGTTRASGGTWSREAGGRDFERGRRRLFFPVTRSIGVRGGSPPFK